jgi:hypothetical protein
MDQYKGNRGTDRQFFLTCWSGEHTKVDRKGTLARPVLVESPFISVLGGIQPEVLSELEDPEGREDGFLHRILFSFPQVQYPQCWDETGLDPHHREAWQEVIERLVSLPFSPEDGPQVLEFSDAGKAAWVAWYNRHLAEINNPNFPRKLRGPWAKFEAYAARLTLILHLLHRVARPGYEPDAPAGLVEEEDVARAERLVDYFKDHTRGVYSQLQRATRTSLARSSKSVKAARRPSVNSCTCAPVSRALTSGVMPLVL